MSIKKEPAKQKGQHAERGAGKPRRTRVIFKMCDFFAFPFAKKKTLRKEEQGASGFFLPVHL